MSESLPHLLQFVNANQPPSSTASATEIQDVIDGRLVLNALITVSPGDFGSIELREDKGDNWVMLRGNVKKVLDAAAAFSVKYLSSAAEDDLASDVDTTAIARDQSPEAVESLLRLIVAVCLLGGGAEAVARVKTLEKAAQTTISRTVKEFATAKGLKKRKDELSASPATASPAASPAAPAPSQRSYGARDDEISALLAQKAELSDNLAAESDSRKAAEEKLKNLQIEFDRLHQQFQEVAQTVASSESMAIRELKDMIEQLKSENATVSAELSAAKTQHDEATSALKHDLDESRKKLKAVEEQLESTKSELRSTSADLKFAKDMTQAHASTKGSLEDHVDRVEAEATAAKQRATEAEAKATQSEARATKFEDMCAMSSARIEELEQQVEMLQRHAEAAPAVQPAALDESPAPVQRNDAEMSQLQARIADLERERDAATADLSRATAAVSSKDGEVEKLKTDLDSERKHLAQAMKRAQSAASNEGSSQDLARATERCTTLEQELADSKDRFRAQLATLSSLVFRQGQRNFALSMELHRRTGRLPKLLGSASKPVDVYMAEDDAGRHPSFLDRTRRELELGPLLEVDADAS